MIWPLAKGSHGWLSALRYTGVALLLGIYWLLVTVTFYSLMLGLLLTMPVWMAYTMRRRHRAVPAPAAVGRSGHCQAARRR